MKLLIYKIRLAFHLGLFILSLTANFSNKAKPIILGLFITGLLITVGGISLLTNNPPAKAITYTTPVPLNSELYSLKNLKEDQLLKEVEHWENVLKVQPQSRDVLLNLAHLYSTLNQEDKAVEYKNKAINIDPNSPLFE